MRIANERGVITAVAMDQRRSLRGMLARAAGTTPDAIADDRLVEFKSAVSEVLTPHASAILVDTEYGLDAAQRRAPNCGLLLTYESDGFENPRPHRMLLLNPVLSVRRLRELGADAIKVLLSYNPEGEPAANDQKHAAIERIGAECEAVGLPFLLEPVVYDASPERKPAMVVRTMAQFTKPEYRVSVLKVEFPISSHSKSLDWYKRADDAAAGKPYIYLSAGVSMAEFLASLDLAREAGAHFSGILCGRAVWQDGIPEFVRGGPRAFKDWLSGQGVENLRQICQRL